MSGKKQRNAERDARRRSASSSFPWLPIGVGVVVLAALVVVVALVVNSQSSNSEANARTIDNVRCESHEAAAMHIHAHLALYVHGQAATVPAGIGVMDPQEQMTTSGPYVANGSCFYWLHSHTADGVIHVEAPQTRTFKLGDYFDIWGKALSSNEVGDASGPVTAYVNGQEFSGDPRSIPITPHAIIQLDVAQDVPPAPYTFPAGL